MSRTPEPNPGSSVGPPRRLSNRDFELVIRRAAELQAREAEGPDADGIDEGEALRIGRELGLSNQYLHRALAEVRGDEEAESGVFARMFGPDTVRASRTVAGDGDKVAALLERHLVEREFLAVLRRLPGRTMYTRATGVVAAVGRATSQVFNRSPLLPVSSLEVAVRQLEEGFVFVSVASSLRQERTTAGLSSMLGGGAGTVASATVLGIAIAPPAALLALPILGASVFAGHAYYRGLSRKVQTQLEFLLDRLEHGELTRPAPPKALSWGSWSP